jgi:ComF family protein
MCPHCEGLAPVYQRAKTVTLFKGPIRELLLELKYRHGTFVLEDIETIIAENVEMLDFIRGATLVPVPLHARKEREREYNQSYLLAEIFCRLAGEGTGIKELLERTLDSDSQTTFDRRSRRQRMKNAFAPRKGPAITAGDRFILVDDVFTTGSTLNSCALALRRAGCLNLDVITFAHG